MVSPRFPLSPAPWDIALQLIVNLSTSGDGEHVFHQHKPLGLGNFSSKILTYVWMCAQSCPALCNFMDCRQPGSSVHGISQARILGDPTHRGRQNQMDRSMLCRRSLVNCRGPAPADPGYSKQRRRRRGSGTSCEELTHWKRL